jgi:hypothetical protein
VGGIEAELGAGNARGFARKRYPVPNSEAGRKWLNPRELQLPTLRTRSSCQDLHTQMGHAIPRFTSFSPSKHALRSRCSHLLRLCVMASRVKLYSQQAALAQLFQRSGYSGELPQFLTSTSAAGADHPLLAWIAGKVRLEENFVSESDQAQAARQLEEERLLASAEPSPSSASASVAAKLSPFEEANDLALPSDQDSAEPMHALGLDAPAWLEEESLEDLDERLRVLAEERALYKSQIQELQALDAQLDEAQRSSRASHVRVRAECEQLDAQLNAERTATSNLNARANALLHEMQVRSQPRSARAAAACHRPCNFSHMLSTTGAAARPAHAVPATQPPVADAGQEQREGGLPAAERAADGDADQVSARANHSITNPLIQNDAHWSPSFSTSMEGQEEQGDLGEKFHMFPILSFSHTHTPSLPGSTSSSRTMGPPLWQSGSPG